MRMTKKELQKYKQLNLRTEDVVYINDLAAELKTTTIYLEKVAMSLGFKFKTKGNLTYTNKNNAAKLRQFSRKFK